MEFLITKLLGMISFPALIERILKRISFVRIYEIVTNHIKKRLKAYVQRTDNQWDDEFYLVIEAALDAILDMIKLEQEKSNIVVKKSNLEENQLTAS